MRLDYASVSCIGLGKSGHGFLVDSCVILTTSRHPRRGRSAKGDLVAIERERSVINDAGGGGGPGRRCSDGTTLDGDEAKPGNKRCVRRSGRGCRKAGSSHFHTVLFPRRGDKLSGVMGCVRENVCG